MNDDEIIEYLVSRARTSPPPGLTRVLMAGVDSAPEARTWFGVLLPVATSLLVVAGAVAMGLLITRGPASLGPGSSSSASASPFYPIAADDPRFAECAGTLYPDRVIAAFPFVATDYHLYFPKMGLSPELEQDSPAFAVVFMEGVEPPGVLPGAWMSGSPPPLTGHMVCVYLGQPPDGVSTYYVNVDITGMRVESAASASSTVSPTATATATQPPRPTPVSSPPAGYITVDGLPITVLSSKRADALFDRVQTCVSPAGYTVSYPARWYTNDATRDTPECSWFGPQPFDGSIRPVTVQAQPPDGVWIDLGVIEGTAGYTSITPVYMTDPVILGGFEGHRAEFGPSTADEIQNRPDFRAYWYVIPLGDSDRTFGAYTNVDRADEYALAKAVVDRMVASVVLDQP